MQFRVCAFLKLVILQTPGVLVQFLNKVSITLFAIKLSEILIRFLSSLFVLRRGMGCMRLEYTQPGRAFPLF